MEENPITKTIYERCSICHREKKYAKVFDGNIILLGCKLFHEESIDLAIKDASRVPQTTKKDIHG